MPPVLSGLAVSVYTRIARLAFAEKGAPVRLEHADPFSRPDDPGLSPFSRVPVLTHEGFRLYETAAILAYADAAFEGPVLTPEDPRARARVVQVIAIADHYGYRPMVRQAFSHAVYRPLVGAEGHAGTVEAGLAASRPVLAALEEISSEGLVLNTKDVGLADIHLAPMIAYFAMVPEAAQMLAGHPRLAAWFERIADRDSFRTTEPPLARPPG